MEKKRFLSMVLVLAMLFSMVGGMQTVGAASVSPFIFDSITGTITGFAVTTGGAIEIPSTIDGVTVTAIGDLAFDGEKITSVTIPASVKRIGFSAFWNCTSLSSIIIANGVESIGLLAFGQTAIQSISLPDSVISIGNDAFNTCSNLESAVLPKNITAIPSQLFLDCPKLKQITIPDKVETIGSYAFGRCYALSEVVLSSSLYEIKNYAFSDCTSLKSVTIPSSVTTIGSGTFTNCSALEEVYFEGNIPSTLEYCFDNINSNCKVYYKSESTGFTGNLQGKPTVPLYSINIETAIGGNISMGTVSEGKTYTETTSGSSIVATWVEANATVNLNVSPDAGKQLKGGSLKYNNGSNHPITGTSFTMPANEVTIYAEFMTAATTNFSVSVGTLTGGNITTNLLNAAPEEIINLTITPEPGNQLKEGTLRYTYNSTEYTINGTSFVMPAGDVSIAAEFEPAGYIFDEFTGTITGYIGSGGTVVIPSSINGVPVTAIGDDAFIAKTSITSVIIPNGVKSIGSNAFNSCYGLVAITIPDGVISIGSYAFSQCHGLISITLPDSVTSMGKNVFYYCDKLVSFNIPTGITNIPYGTFNRCYLLTSITIPDNIEIIGGYAFYNCPSLRSIKLPSSLTTIEAYAFNYCSNLALAMFAGNAPSGFSTEVFQNTSSSFKILYKTNSTGFTTPTWNGYSCSAYDPAVTYTVTYDTNEADTGSAPASVTMLDAGKVIIASDNTGSLVKSGYRFDGWNTAADGLGVNYDAADQLVICDSNVTLYAKWARLYNITINTVQNGKLSAIIENRDAAKAMNLDSIVECADTVNATAAAEGDSIRVTVTPDANWWLKPGTLKYNDGTKDYVIDRGFSGPKRLAESVIPVPVSTTGTAPVPAPVPGSTGRVYYCETNTTG